MRKKENISQKKKSVSVSFETSADSHLSLFIYKSDCQFGMHFNTNLILLLLIGVNPWHGNCSLDIDSKNITKRQANNQENFIFGLQRSHVEGN